MNIFAAIESFQGSTLIYAIIFLFALAESMVVIGLIFPGTTLMVFIGYLVSRGQLDFFLAILMLSIGGITGDIISFYLGRSGKRIFQIIEKIIKPKRLERAEIFFKKYGSAGVVAHRFIGPLRPLLPFAAGFLKMRSRVFVPIDIFSNLISSLFYVSIGFLVGQRWQTFIKLFDRYEKAALLIIFLLLLSYIILSKKPRK